MRIKRLSGYDDRCCENCGKLKGKPGCDDKNLISTIWGIYIGSSDKPDYMLCNECMQELFDCVKNVTL